MRASAVPSIHSIPSYTIILSGQEKTTNLSVSSFLMKSYIKELLFIVSLRCQDLF